MKLYNIFNEDWQTVRGYDRERYGELPGLEGPISTKSGKVLYYDPKEGKYYDRNSDMYLDHEEALAFLNEDNGGDVQVTSKKSQRILNQIRQNNPQARNDLEALLMAFEKGQKQDRADIVRLGLENDQEEMDIEDLQRQLDRIKARRGIGEAETNKEKAERAAMAKIQDQFKDMPKYTPQSAEERAKAHKKREAQAMAKAKENADMLMKLADKHGENIEANEVGYFAKGIADGKRGYRDPKASDALGPNVYAYDAGVRVGETLASINETEFVGLGTLEKQDKLNHKQKQQGDGTYDPSTAGVVKRAGKPGKPMFGVGILKPAKDIKNEDYYDTDEQRELARLGRIIMDMGAKRDDDIGAAMGAVGMELTKYGTPQGVSSIQKLEKVTGQPESVIMKMMALAQKVQGDVAVGDDVPDEEIEEAPSTTDDAYFNQQRGVDGYNMDFAGPDQPLVKGPNRSASTPLIKNPTWGQPGHEPTLRPNQQLVTKADKLKGIPFIGDRAASAYAQGVAQDPRASQATKTAVAKTAAGTTPVQIPKIQGQPDTPKAKQKPSNITHNITKGSKKVVPTRKGADPLGIFSPKKEPEKKPAPAPKKQDDITFAQAFRAARKAHGGPGGAFMWRGKKYQTNVKGEKYVKNPVLVQSKQYEDKSWSEINKELGDKYGDDIGMNWNPKAPSLSGAAHTTYKYLTQPRSGDKSGQMKRKGVNESDWEENFIKRLKAKISGSPEVQAYLDLKAKQWGDQNLDLDPGAAEKGLGIGVLDVAKARKKAKEKGVRAPGSLRASPNTRNPERLPESQLNEATLSFDCDPATAKRMQSVCDDNNVECKMTGNKCTLTGSERDILRVMYKMKFPTNVYSGKIQEAKDDIKIGDTVQTLKMGQMQGTVTGFSKKGGIDKVMFKHESGKTYAAVPENLKVISAKKTESLDNTVVEADSQSSYYKAVTGGNYKPMTPAEYAKMDKEISAQVAKIPPKGGWMQSSKDIGQGLTAKISPSTGYKDVITNKQNDHVATRQTSLVPGLTVTKNRQDSPLGKAGTTTNRYSNSGLTVTQTTDTKTGKQLSKVGSFTIPGKGTTTKPIESIEEAKKKPVPTDPDKWAYAKAQAKKKFDVYPSAYANAWAAKKYKELGGGWRMGNPKKK
jgi:hypothetical protein